MSKNVKIYEIARNLGIASSELVEICQKSGYSEITHHSNAVPPEKAEEIRRTAIKKYKPADETPTRKKRPPKKKAPEKEKKETAEKKAAEEKKEEKKKEKETKAPSAEEVTPVAPPAPRGKGAPGRAEREEAEEKTTVEKPRKRRERRPRKEEGEKIKKRTIVFKEPKKPPEKKKEHKIEMTPPVTVRDLSERLGISAADILQTLMFQHNVRATINQTLTQDLVELMGLEYDVEITFRQPKTAEQRLFESLPEDEPEDLRPRPPVITLLGHVDHGKTTILDHIRHTNVVDAEDGGITQDIGAWQISRDGHALTFVDTPGHEAFTAMRARGAQVTDVVVLVVAADDGVMPQTEEAIDHARAAEVPIVVAINKMDKPEADPEAVRRQLAGAELSPEEWGGETGCVEMSALKGEGIEDLLERIVLEAELLELKANPDREAQGVVLEAEMQEGLGVVGNVIVQNGTLRQGDVVLCGGAFGRVRSMFNEAGDEVTEAPPSAPVAISGLNRVPEAGTRFLVVENLDTAREIAEERLDEIKARRVRPREHVTLENLYERLAEGRAHQLNIILKGDVQGSLEPLLESLERLNTEEVSTEILHEGIGNVNESDVLLADASDAIIIAFRVGMDERARALAEEKGVQIRDYRVIYRAIQDVRQALEGLLEPEKKEERLGVAEVRALFDISNVGKVAGCYVVDGVVRRDGRARVRRDGEVVHEGRIASLRREKDDVKKVESGYECGLRIEGFNDIQVGDAIECFQIKEVKRTLS